MFSCRDKEAGVQAEPPLTFFSLLLSRVMECGLHKAGPPRTPVPPTPSRGAPLVPACAGFLRARGFLCSDAVQGPGSF